jgi:hypothetical protein
VRELFQIPDEQDDGDLRHLGGLHVEHEFLAADPNCYRQSPLSTKAAQ